MKEMMGAQRLVAAGFHYSNAGGYKESHMAHVQTEQQHRVRHQTVV
ncbi:MAG: hypothetical protein Q8L02_06975 [Candidatus Nitrotoga sp.]|nr:hypothetical protein [Candidatus Nitrotoga sp.]